MEQKEEICHEDLYKKIESLENRMQFWAKTLLAIFTPVLVSLTGWVWGVTTNLQTEDVRLNERITSNSAKYGLAREAQARIETRLDDMMKFLREDSKELREMIKGQHEH